MDFSEVDLVFAQSSNSLAQEGDDNEASESEEKSQDSNQNSMCVSGESVSLSCNNLSSEQGSKETAETQSISGKLYTVEGPLTSRPDIASSTADCREGDDVLSGGFDAINRNPNAAINSIQSHKLSSSSWAATIDALHPTEPVAIQAFAYCFDNP